MDKRILETVQSIRNNHNRPDSEAIYRVLLKDLGDEFDMEYFKETLISLEETGVIENRLTKEGKESFYVVNTRNDFSCQVSSEEIPVSRSEFMSLKNAVSEILRKNDDKHEEATKVVLLNKEISWQKRELTSKDCIIQILQDQIETMKSLMRDRDDSTYNNQQINLKRKFDIPDDDEFKDPKRYSKPKHREQQSNIITNTQNRYHILSDESSEDDIDNDFDINPRVNVNSKTHNNKSIKNKTTRSSRNYREKNKQRKTVIIGDSMINGVKPWEMRKSLKQNVQLKSFAGAKVDDMEHYIIPSKNIGANVYILHVGTNDVRSEKTPNEIAESVMEAASSLSTQENEVMVSGLCKRGDDLDLNKKVLLVNAVLKRKCKQTGMIYICNENIDESKHLNGSKLHLNREGDSILASNFLKALRF